MMRIAAIAATEGGIEVCCPVHDAFLISARADRIDDDVMAMRPLMSKAGRAVTGGLDVRTDVKIARWPDRYMDKRGEGMWRRVMNLLERTHGPGLRGRNTTFAQTQTDLRANEKVNATFAKTERSLGPLS